MEFGLEVVKKHPAIVPKCNKKVVGASRAQSRRGPCLSREMGGVRWYVQFEIIVFQSHLIVIDLAKKKKKKIDFFFGRMARFLVDNRYGHRRRRREHGSTARPTPAATKPRMTPDTRSPRKWRRNLGISISLS
jgi:hypothetical protein